MSSSKNLEFEKTSFLNKANSAFIEQMYLKYINKDADLPESWLNYFEGIGDELNIIAKEINGPSWSPQKKKIDIDELQKKIERCKKKMPYFLKLRSFLYEASFPATCTPGGKDLGRALERRAEEGPTFTA